MKEFLWPEPTAPLSSVNPTPSLPRKTALPAVLWYCAAMLLLLSLLLTGCAATSTLPSEQPAPPLMPAITTPLPSVSYSSRVQQLIESWRKRATATLPTSEL